jgi:hypothetical protein
MPLPSHHVTLALYVDDTTFIATSRQPALLAVYLESYLSDLEQWLREQRITISVMKSTAMLFTKIGRCILKPRPVQLFRELIHWVNTALYLGVTIDAQLTWLTDTD